MLNDHTTPQYEFRWIENGAILKITSYNVSEQVTVDAYYNKLDEYIRQWPAEKPYLLLFDSTQTQVEKWTTYMRQRAEQSHQIIPLNFRGRTASVVKPGVLIHIVKPFVEMGLNRKKPNVVSRIFYKYDDALAWLKAFAPE